MAFFVAIVLGPASLFLLYVLVQFGREGKRLQTAKHRAAATMLPEVSADAFNQWLGRVDSVGTPTGQRERGNRGVLTFPSGAKHSSRRGTA